VKAKLASHFWRSATLASVLAASCYPDFDGLTSEAGRAGSGGLGNTSSGSGGISGKGGSTQSGGEPGDGTGGAIPPGGEGSVSGTSNQPMAGAGGSSAGDGGGGGGEGGEPATPTCDASAVPVGAAAIIQYPLNEGTGSVVEDASASGKDGILTGATWDTKGHEGAAVKLGGEGQRITIPSGVLETLERMTLMAWVKPIATPANSTLFDVGTDGENHFALEIGTSLRLVAKTSTVDQALLGAIALPKDRWTHVALTLGDGKAVAYVDGRPLVSGDVALKPSDLGALAEAWIGQSHGTGTNTYGLIDQVELFDRVVEQREVMAKVLVGADYLYFPFDELCPTGTDAVPAEVPRGLSGRLPNGATLVDGRLGKAIQLSALLSQYVELPNGLIADCTENFTYAGWVYLTTANKWARLFDFGLNDATYFYMSPSAEGGGVRFAATLVGQSAEQSLAAPTVVPLGAWHHFAVTIKAATGKLYFDGAEIASSAQIVINPSDMGPTTNNWFGRSQYASDNYLNGRLDDVVISCRAFTPDEIGLLAKLAAP
jgi:hypothetical protein